MTIGRAAAAVDQVLVMRNWVIGGYIIEFEQQGFDRAAYGAGLLRRLSHDLTQRGMKGVSPDLLERMRLVYQRCIFTDKRLLLFMDTWLVVFRDIRPDTRTLPVLAGA